MKAGLVAIAGAVLLAMTTMLPATAAEKKQEKPHSAEEIKKDIANHRAMAEAHLNAAKCLESGQSEKACQAQLVKDCKGLAIGKYCGMRHAH